MRSLANPWNTDKFVINEVINFEDPPAQTSDLGYRLELQIDVHLWQAVQQATLRRSSRRSQAKVVNSKHP